LVLVIVFCGVVVGLFLVGWVRGGVLWGGGGGGGGGGEEEVLIGYTFTRWI